MQKKICTSQDALRLFCGGEKDLMDFTGLVISSLLEQMQKDISLYSPPADLGMSVGSKCEIYHHGHIYYSHAYRAHWMRQVSVFVPIATTEQKKGAFGLCARAALWG